MNVGKYFLKARLRKGIDQNDAAAALEVSPSFLSKVERNKKKASHELIQRAAAFYGVKEAYFFQEEDEIDIERLYTDNNKEFIKDLAEMKDIELKEKYKVVLDGKELSDLELKGVIAYVRSLRSMD